MNRLSAGAQPARGKILQNGTTQIADQIMKIMNAKAWPRPHLKNRPDNDPVAVETFLFNPLLRSAVERIPHLLAGGIWYLRFSGDAICPARARSGAV